MCSDNGCCMTHKLCNVHVKSMLSCGGCGDSGNIIFSEFTCNLETAAIVCIGFDYYKGRGETASLQTSSMCC